jgi:hypothetical protein
MLGKKTIMVVQVEEKRQRWRREEDKGNCEVWRSGFVWKTGRFKVGL